MSNTEPVTYRTERFDTATNGWRHDDLEVWGAHAARAISTAREATRGSSVSRRVVNEQSGVTIATFRRGRRVG